MKRKSRPQGYQTWLFAEELGIPPGQWANYTEAKMAGREQRRIKTLQDRFRSQARKAQGKGYHYRGIKKITHTDSIVMVHCPNPAHHWHPMRYDLILQGCKCRECAGRHQPLEERRAKFETDFHRKHGYYHYEVHVEDYVNNDTPIRVRCLLHNYDFTTSPDNLLRGGGGCKFCCASEGEATILGWLDNHNIEYTWHFPIINNDPTLDLNYVEADFYLEREGREVLVIEYHGEQHYREIDHFRKSKKGRQRNLALQQHRDHYLRKYCQERRWRLLEIPYWDLKRIDEILTEELIE